MAFFLSGVIYNYTEVTFNVNNIVCFGLWLIAVRYGQLSVSKVKGAAGLPTKSQPQVPLGRHFRAPAGNVGTAPRHAYLRSSGNPNQSRF
jgi:hypothetical protein